MVTSTTELTAALRALPKEWALTPVNQKKAYFASWQQTGLARELIEQDITSRNADGFGILTGELSGGLIAIDCDGHEPHARFKEILGGEIPETVSFASGKDGRAQYLFSVPQEAWARVQNKVEQTSDGQLDSRWNGRYSVLPPSAHPETKGYNWVKSPDDCSIAPLPQAFLEFLLLANQPKVSRAKIAPKKVGGVTSIPLKRCLSNVHREALKNGVGEGSRNQTAHNLAKDLLGCAEYLTSLDEAYSGDPRSLYLEYCDRCVPPLPEREREATWKSASKGEQSPSISDPEAFQNCIDKWKRENGLAVMDRSMSGNSTPIMDAVTAAVNNLSGAELTAELAAIAKCYDRTFQTIEKMASQILDETDAREFEQNTKESIEWLQQTKTATLNIYDVLPESLAEPIDRISRDIGQNSAPYILALVFGAGGVAHMGTMVKIMNGFRVPTTIYGSMVARPGSKKTNVYKTMLERPLGMLQADETKKYREELEEYETAFAEWDCLTKEERVGKKRPIEPTKITIYSTNATIEGLVKQACKYFGSSALYVKDELAGVLNSLNAYKNSGGGDTEAVLVHYEPAPVNQLRASGLLSSDHDVRFAIFGCLTTRGIEVLVKDGDDSNGMGGRFLLIPVEYSPQMLKENNINTDVLISDIYRTIHNFPQTELVLSPLAFASFNPIQFDWSNKAKNSQSGWISNIYSKAIGQLGRIAGALHLIDCAINNTLTPEIPLETLLRAKKLMDFSMNFSLSLVSEKSGDIPPKLAKLIELAETKGDVGLTVADAAAVLRETVNGKTTKPKAETVIGYFRAIESMGLGQLEKTSRSFKLKKLTTTEILPNCPSSTESFASKELETGQGSDLLLSSCPSSCLDVVQLGQLGQSRSISCPPESFTEKEIQPIGTTRTRFQVEEDLKNPKQEQINYIPLGEIEDDY
jgi:Protein of unknown function (DUF3987)/Bifunctional DNA primase/polymerase, N-terminal